MTAFVWIDRDGRRHELDSSAQIEAEAAAVAHEMDTYVAMLDDPDRKVRDPARSAIGRLQPRLEQLRLNLDRWNAHAVRASRAEATALADAIDTLPMAIAEVAFVVALHDEHDQMIAGTSDAPNTRADNLAGAGTRAAYSALFDILHEPDRAPISYGVELNKVRKAMGEDFQAVLDRAADLAANDERFKPAEALDALQIEPVIDPDAPETAPAKPKPVVPVTSEPIFGHDDQPVAAYERLSDNVDRIRLPDVAGMSLAEREIAAAACIKQIRRHFGLDEQG